MNDSGDVAQAPVVIDPERGLDALRSMPPEQLVEPGVTAGDALAVMTMPPVPAGSVHVPDQVYGTAGRGGRDLTMHLYRAADRHERRPGVVFIHGGGFQEGFPEMLIRYASALAERGYVTASIRYRLSGEAPFPACVEDAKCAVRWMRRHSGELGLDADRIGVAGNSAGGHLAAMVANTPGRFEGTGGHDDVSSRVRAAVLLYPAVDLRPSASTEIVRELASKLLDVEPGDLIDDLAATASPMTYVDSTTAPTLTMAGGADPLIPLETVEEYHRRLTDAAVENELVVVPGVGHSFDYNLQRWHESCERMAAWFDRHLDTTPAIPTPDRIQK